MARRIALRWRFSVITARERTLQPLNDALEGGRWAVRTKIRLTLDKKSEGGGFIASVGATQYSSRTQRALPSTRIARQAFRSLERLARPCRQPEATRSLSRPRTPD